MNAQALRYALVGDGLSPHLAKWARALAPRVELWVASSTGLHPAIAACVPASRRLVLGSHPKVAGGNVSLLMQWPRLVRWLAQVDADWINPHYLSSHGTLVWAASRWSRLRGRVLASAWGSDVLVTPEQQPMQRWALRRVLAAAALATSDSEYMAERMRHFGSREVMVFPFGLEAMPEVESRRSANPAASLKKQPWLVYANRALEPNYRPQAVLQWFVSLLTWQPEAQLVLANDGSLRPSLQAWVRERGLSERVSFVGHLGADAQHGWYERAQWFVSLPASDSVSVSLIEALAHGCLPVLADLPANREWVRHAVNGLILRDAESADAVVMQTLLARAQTIAQDNRARVARDGLFEPCMERLIERLRTLR